MNIVHINIQEEREKNVIQRDNEKKRKKNDSGGLRTLTTKVQCSSKDY